MSVIGEAALSAFMKLLIGKLVSSALDFVKDHKQVHRQLKEWQSILPNIIAVLNDAEEKQIKDERVKNWLADLQDLAYDVDDVLDEFAYEVLRLKLQKSQANTSKVHRLIPACCTSHFTPTAFMFNNKMISKIKEITARLNNLVSQKSLLELREIGGGARSKGTEARPPTTSLPDETHVYGRENEKQKILELLMSNENEVLVIPIVGIGGIGKTTLAQHVFNDDSIKTIFGHRAWACVSEDFDAIAITKKILQSIIDPEPCPNTNYLDLLQRNLKEKLSGKSFLLVLDDVWNENYVDLTNLLKPFGVGTKIIVTTRSEEVARIIRTVETCTLKQLSEEDCASIFTKHALGASDFSGCSDLKEVGENIVRKCNGLPLAAKAIGGLLRNQDHTAWKRISESELWDLPEEQCGIIPALRLSYHHLPSHLKQCFAYCSILPKDYEFKEEELILLWRAEGFLQQKTKGQIQDLGSQYFRDLVSRSFFQKSGKDGSLFIMHDLINDLAQLVAGEICAKLEGGKQQKLSNRTRHSSYVRSSFDGVKVYEEFDQAKYLRTFLPLTLQTIGLGHLTNVVLVDLLPRLRVLRVLSLSGYQITELPDFFTNLKHLRHLDFSDTTIRCLPDSLCTLYQLETLILRNCYCLEELPSEIWNLVNLHYLDMEGADRIKRMPFGIGKLTNLQRLSNFVLGEGDGHHIREVKNLSNVRGDFCLSGLENIVKCQDACEAKLGDKLGLDTLVLKWSTEFDNNKRNKNVEEQVLDFLRPPNKLERLTIENYGGAKFSVWIVDSSFKNLLSLKLLNCKNCKSLPSVGKLPLLKDLHIRAMDDVNKVGVEFFGGNQSDAFASLESLCFEDMPNWKEWDSCKVNEQVLKFPGLRELSMVNCPQLLGRLPISLHSLQKLVIRGCTQLIVSISSLPCLLELIIDGCEELMYSDVADITSLQSVSLSNISKSSIPPERIVSRLTKLEYFEISGCKELASLSQNDLGLIGHLSSLRDVRISDCPQLVSLETKEVKEEKLQRGKFSSIESLTILRCERLNRLPKVLHILTFLTEMQIAHCPSLVSFAENNLPPTLKRLEIWNCKNLQYLLDERENKNVSNTCLLQYLVIHECPSLICLSSRGYVPNRLQHLEIWLCPKLTSLFLNAMLPIMLKKLLIESCPELECISQEFHENTCLESIQIWSCGKIKSLPRGLDKLSHLQEVKIGGCSNLVCSEESGLPTSNLRVFWCENFGALPQCMNNFTSLRELRLEGCSADISFPEYGFPTSLTTLGILKAPKIYKSLVEWGLHRLTSLQRLDISGEGCSDVVSFPDDEMMLPPSLTSMCIIGFENLKSMLSEGFQNLTSLEGLSVHYCPKLESLPEKDMLLSIKDLLVSGCPLLIEELKKGEGREWSKIAHIPLVEIY